jgi:hypothetical protein
MFLASESTATGDGEEPPAKQQRRARTDYAAASGQGRSDEEIIELTCPICLMEMLPPSTRRTRRYYVRMCGLHITHPRCKQGLLRRGCPTCREPLVENEEIDETASIIFWKAGLQPACGCGKQHTREAAANCKQRLTMCPETDCHRIFFLDKIEAHYAKKHKGLPVPANHDEDEAEPPPPTCPFEGCTADLAEEPSIHDHIANCSYRPMQCVCGFQGPLITVETHQQSCRSVKCPASECVKACLQVDVPLKRCTHSIREHCPLESLIHLVSTKTEAEITNILSHIATLRQAMAIRPLE